jgi:hypothetical protein
VGDAVDVVVGEIVSVAVSRVGVALAPHADKNMVRTNRILIRNIVFLLDRIGNPIID